MAIARKIKESMEKSSWIRKMFEDGARMKAELGEENVYDYSLGNPNIPPPPEFYEALNDLLAAPEMLNHAYMPNAGYPDARRVIARQIGEEQQTPEMGEGQLILTCGAGGALNTTLKAVLDPGDEVLTPRPFFVEYVAYADNHQGVLKTVPTSREFDLLIDEFDKMINAKTRAIILNSPNNPTGKVYSEENLRELAALVEAKSAEYGRKILVISDEPYRKIVYDGLTVPPIFPIFKHSVVCTSYSKDLSLAGERIGYAAINPESRDASELMAAMTLTNRILGYVNAPALMQRVVARLQGVLVDMRCYEGNRALIYNGLNEIGYECHKPEGSFFLFPRSPIEDDVAFVKMLQQENILAVPGSGFGGPGHFRLSYSCNAEMVNRSMPGFARAFEKANNG